MTYREAISLGEKILTMAGIADVKTPCHRHVRGLRRLHGGFSQGLRQARVWPLRQRHLGGPGLHG